MLAETLPTCAMMSPETGLESDLTSSTAISTALSMPRLMATILAQAIFPRGGQSGRGGRQPDGH